MFIDILSLYKLLRRLLCGGACRFYVRKRQGLKAALSSGICAMLLVCENMRNIQIIVRQITVTV